MIESTKTKASARTKHTSQQRRGLDLKIKSSIKAGGLMFNHNRNLRAS
jgi:hypothetical protein